MTHDEMDQLTASLGSKAAKARALNEAGVSTADIGRYLDIRYQHVYNILLRAGAIQKADKSEAPATVFDGDAEIIVGQIGSEGGIVLPDDIMRRYGLVAGEPIFCRALPDGLVVLSREAAQRAVTQAAREKMPEHAALVEALFNMNLSGNRKP